MSSPLVDDTPATEEPSGIESEKPVHSWYTYFTFSRIIIVGKIRFVSSQNSPLSSACLALAFAIQANLALNAFGEFHDQASANFG
jgi:hypothetical protein